MKRELDNQDKTPCRPIDGHQSNPHSVVWLAERILEEFFDIANEHETIYLVTRYPQPYL